EGAHEGGGLGAPLVAHVKRRRPLRNLDDVTIEHAGRAYNTVRAELEAYGQGLGDKPEVVALSKADALTPEQLKQQSARLNRAAETPPLVVSAVTGAGLSNVLRALLSLIEQDQKRPAVA